jgi:mycothiol synthase
MTNIRPFDKERDHPGRVALFNLLNPDSLSTEEESRRYDDARPKHLHHGVIVAEKNGEIIGFSDFSQWEKPNLHKFNVYVDVHPAHQRQGTGTALYRAVMDAIASHQPIELRTVAPENVTSRMHFLPKLGFIELKRTWNAHLEVANFEPGVLQDVEDKIIASGINIYSYAELFGDPDRETKLYELNCIVTDAVFKSHVMPYTAPSLEEFKKDFLEDNPHFMHDEWFIAVEGDSKNGKYVGATVLLKPDEGDYRKIYLTGVLSEYHRRGIASALKLRAVLYARENNIPEIRTDGASKVMLAINEKMGFVKQPALVYFEKGLTTETEVIA